MDKVVAAAEALLKNASSSDKEVLCTWKDFDFDKDSLRGMVRLQMEYGKLRVDRVSGLVDLYCCTFEVSRADLAKEYTLQTASSGKGIIAL